MMLWLLQVVALCQAPFLLDDPNVGLIFPADAIARAKHYLAMAPGGLGNILSISSFLSFNVLLHALNWVPVLPFYCICKWITNAKLSNFNLFTQKLLSTLYKYIY
jgi:hypothetical protein